VLLAETIVVRVAIIVVAVCDRRGLRVDEELEERGAHAKQIGHVVSHDWCQGYECSGQRVGRADEQGSRQCGRGLEGGEPALVGVQVSLVLSA
jgi:hypothetical protein